MNRERLIELMRRHDVAAVVAVTPSNVCYLTGHVGWAQHVYRSLPCVAAFTDDGTPGVDLVVPRSETPYHAARPSSAERVAGYRGRAGLIPEDPGRVPTDEEQRFEALQASCAVHRTPTDAVVSLLAERTVNGRCVVVDDAFLVPGLVDRLRTELGASDVLISDGLFLMAQLVKTPDEIDRMRAAAQVNEQALTVAMGEVEAGASESDVASTWRREIAGAGAVPLWFHLGSGGRSAYVFPPSDKTFEVGELFMLDAGLTLNGLLADSGLCGSIGEPSARAAKEFDACRTAIATAESVIEEGVRPSSVFGALCDGLVGTALDGAYVPFAGHTIGFDAREFPFVLGPATAVADPFLPDTSDIPLPAGTTINVELPLGRLGWGGYQIEKTYVVRPGGFDLLIDVDREMLVR